MTIFSRRNNWIGGLMVGIALVVLVWVWCAWRYGWWPFTATPVSVTSTTITAPTVSAPSTDAILKIVQQDISDMARDVRTIKKDIGVMNNQIATLTKRVDYIEVRPAPPVVVHVHVAPVVINLPQLQIMDEWIWDRSNDAWYRLNSPYTYPAYPLPDAPVMLALNRYLVSPATVVDTVTGRRYYRSP